MKYESKDAERTTFIMNCLIHIKIMYIKYCKKKVTKFHLLFQSIHAEKYETPLVISGCLMSLISYFRF